MGIVELGASLGGALVLMLSVAWVTGKWETEWSQQRVAFAVANCMKLSQKPLSRNKLHVVLYWLKGDRKGGQARIIEQSFNMVSSVDLYRSAFHAQVPKPDDADKLLERNGADLVITGEVSQPAGSTEELMLWVVAPTIGKGAPSHNVREVPLMANAKYTTRQFQYLIVTHALTALVQASNERSKVLEQELNNFTTQTQGLLVQAGVGYNADASGDPDVQSNGGVQNESDN